MENPRLDEEKKKNLPLEKSVYSPPPLWWKEAVIYEVHVKSFFDGNNDGIGDFLGLTQKLDYIQSLGVNAIWLLPFYPSPLKDDGYDISDYCSIHPDYGELKDFNTFLNEAHKRALRVIIELVINHTSDQHPWFQRARVSPPGSLYRNYYVWSDNPEKYKEARIIFKDFESSNWAWDPVAKAYYWHRFYSHQPDLNFDNPEVKKEIFKILDFWLSMGVDGLRLDAVPYLFEREGTSCENLPETHNFLKELRSYVDNHYENRMLLAEANQWPEEAVAYFGNGDECHMAFHFPLMPRIFMAMRMEDNYPIVDILELTPPIPDNCQWATFLRNHDELTLEMVTDEERDYMYRVYALESRARLNLGIRRRLAPLLDNNRKKRELIFMILFSLMGSPIIYYGDEIGMGDNIYLGDRNGVRTPMQWSGEKNGGFSKANPQQLYLPLVIDPEYHYTAVNVELQQNNLSSFLWWIRRVIAMRKKYSAFSRGTIEMLNQNNPKVLAFIRKHNQDSILVVINLSRFTQVTEITLSNYHGYIPTEIFGKASLPKISENPLLFVLSPYAYFWFSLNPADESSPNRLQRFSSISLENIPSPSFWLSMGGERFASQIIPLYLSLFKWFNYLGKTLLRVEVKEAIELNTLRFLGGDIQFVLFWFYYDTGNPEPFILFLKSVYKKEAEAIEKINPQWIFCKFKENDQEGILIDAMHEPTFRSWILDWIASARQINLAEGKLISKPSPKLEELLSKGKLPVQSQILPEIQRNFLVNFENKIICKFYRPLNEGINPEIEILEYLEKESSVPFFPSYLGRAEFLSTDKTTYSFCLIQEYVPNQGDGWQLTVDSLSRFFERVVEAKALFFSPSDLLKVPSLNWPAECKEILEGTYFEKLRLIAEKTALMHNCLSNQPHHPDFSAEPINPWYQRSLFQSAMEYLLRIQRRLSKNEKEKKSEPLSKFLEKISSIEDQLHQILIPGNYGQKIRIHGDFHLQQLLYTGKDFVIIDFEGESELPFSQRKLKKTAFKDVASMIFSLFLAAYSALDASLLISQDRLWLEEIALCWHRYAASVFVNRYLELIRPDLIPAEKEAKERLLYFCMLERVLYEIEYSLKRSLLKEVSTLCKAVLSFMNYPLNLVE
ncbi:maltose alpha-D-glucosyltransferase [Methylacidiphilum caldifontis]|nr:maltose alpha-D-glucosyltransferase [Methylacidiphilum caldifontis]